MTRPAGFSWARGLLTAVVAAASVSSAGAQTPFSPYASNILRVQENLRGASVRNVRIAGARSTPEAELLRQVKTTRLRELCGAFVQAAEPLVFRQAGCAMAVHRIVFHPQVPTAGYMGRISVEGHIRGHARVVGAVEPGHDRTYCGIEFSSGTPTR